MQELKAGEIVDRYRVQCRLGEGGMATVYWVQHTRLHSDHALKVLHLPFPALQDRLVLEGRAQAAIRHQNLLAVTDIIEVHGSPALVMDFIAGPSLRGLLNEYKPSLEEAQLLFLHVLQGIRAAHKRGYIHRDLKPENILIEKQEDEITPKIADFGLAKLLGADAKGPSRTKTGVMMGTPAYMAPEQITDASSVTDKADIFSLGVIAYELLLGHPPFKGKTISEIMQSISAGNYRKPEDLDPSIPKEYSDIIDKALQIEPEERFETIDDFLDSWEKMGNSKLGFSAELKEVVENLSWKEAPQNLQSSESDMDTLDLDSFDTLPESSASSETLVWNETNSETETSNTVIESNAPVKISEELEEEESSEEGFWGNDPSKNWMFLVGILLGSFIFWRGISKDESNKAEKPSEKIEKKRTLFDDMERPYHDFIMGLNAEKIEDARLRRKEHWDARLYEDVVARTRMLSKDKELFAGYDRAWKHWGAVLLGLREAGLPEIIAAVPWVESHYQPELQSTACAKGLWQFMPETAAGAEKKYGIALTVKDCQFKDEPDTLWSPDPDGRAGRDSIYIRDNKCRIPSQKGCTIDKRKDVKISTQVALEMFKDAWEKQLIQDSGMAVEFTILSHFQGLGSPDQKGEEVSSVLPRLKRWNEKYPAERHIYSKQFSCEKEAENPKEDCLKVFLPWAREALVNSLTHHFLAVCYFAKNYSDYPEFRIWRPYKQGYCSRLEIPTRQEALQSDSK